MGLLAEEDISKMSQIDDLERERLEELRKLSTEVSSQSRQMYKKYKQKEKPMWKHLINNKQRKQPLHIQESNKNVLQTIAREPFLFQESEHPDSEKQIIKNLINERFHERFR